MPARLPADTARRVLAVLALLGALTACETSPGPMPSSPAMPASATGSPEPAELAALRARPLRLPTLPPGGACPAAQPAPLNPPPPTGHPLSTGAPASALGHAPLFPDARFFHGHRAQLQVRAKHGDPGWYGAKTPWASRTGYRGWTLIRTARLDGPGQARVQLRLPEGPEGAERTKTSDAVPVDVQADWQFWPGSTEVTNAGCYAYQVDGADFTEVIVFRADLVS